MPLMTINLPPGMYKNGTPYSRRGRWTDGNLIRWHDGSIRPVGGWSRRRETGDTDVIPALYSTPADEAVRDIFAWRNLNNEQNIVFGSNLALYYLDATGSVTDITYSGYSANNSSKDPQLQAGYGQNPYGVASYGVGNNLVGADAIPPDRWYFDNFGEILLTGVRRNGGIYELDNSTLTLSQVSNSPSVIQDLCITDQRQVFVVGAEDEPRRVQASDIEDRTAWTPTTSNQAIDRTLAGSGRLLRCINVLRQVLILGETDAHVARYVGPPFVYSIDLAGENCGPIAAEAIARTDRFAVWWGDRNFWLYDGSIQVLNCEVIDFLYDDLDPQTPTKISAFTNNQFTEIWWLYQSKQSTTGEVDSYVVWDYITNVWYTGRLNRTAGIDKGVATSVIMVTPDGEIFNHELDDVLPDDDVFVESGTLELGNGERNLAVQYIYPDTEGTGGVEYRLIARQMPNGVENTFGPYDFQSSDPIPTTGVLGRSIKIRADMTDADAELGLHRLDIPQMGTGKR